MNIKNYKEKKTILHNTQSINKIKIFNFNEKISTQLSQEELGRLSSKSSQNKKPKLTKKFGTSSFLSGFLKIPKTNVPKISQELIFDYDNIIKQLQKNLKKRKYRSIKKDISALEGKSICKIQEEKEEYDVQENILDLKNRKMK